MSAHGGRGACQLPVVCCKDKQGARGKRQPGRGTEGARRAGREGRAGQ